MLAHWLKGAAQPTAVGGVVSPSTLFSSGEKGFWYEISPDTCYTDDAGTINATVGDKVAFIDDLSGNGHNAYQDSSGRRMILQQEATGEYYLEEEAGASFTSGLMIDYPGEEFTTSTDIMLGLHLASSDTYGVILFTFNGQHVNTLVVDDGNPADPVHNLNGSAWVNDTETTTSNALHDAIQSPAVVELRGCNMSLYDNSASSTPQKLRLFHSRSTYFNGLQTRFYGMIFLPEHDESDRVVSYNYMEDLIP